MSLDHVSGTAVQIGYLHSRDHLSHCDGDPQSVPHVLAERVLVIVLYLCMKYDRRHASGGKPSLEHRP